MDIFLIYSQNTSILHHNRGKISKSDAELKDSKNNGCWKLGFWRRNRVPLLLFLYKQKLRKYEFSDDINLFFLY